MLILAKKSRYRAGNTRISFNKTTIEIGEAQKDLDILNGGRSRPFRDRSNSIWLHRDAIRRDDEAEEGNGGDVKLALAKLASQAVFSETG
jgi:hypothetical protein